MEALVRSVVRDYAVRTPLGVFRPLTELASPLNQRVLVSYFWLCVLAEYRPACLQKHSDLQYVLPPEVYEGVVEQIQYSENCLFLDLYVPGQIDANK